MSAACCSITLHSNSSGAQVKVSSRSDQVCVTAPGDNHLPRPGPAQPCSHPPPRKPSGARAPLKTILSPSELIAVKLVDGARILATSGYSSASPNFLFSISALTAQARVMPRRRALCSSFDFATLTLVCYAIIHHHRRPKIPTPDFVFSTLKSRLVPLGEFAHSLIQLTYPSHLHFVR
ncbi:hypothetical protein N656DRAFT_778654 [Canariomyces notabilis]|uniref:Uncharacterized protein n=1 Tax=Canariomyces notabilis TaxID=2074819 RepID=A0AAN6YTI6_9PEZI|nr:hypothetical protein N656DRAFT_778654 [Canariomyces arenarius]